MLKLVFLVLWLLLLTKVDVVAAFEGVVDAVYVVVDVDYKVFVIILVH